MNQPAPRSLEERIIRFLETQPGAENVEKLPQTPAQRESQQVDFFLNNREVLCELKSFETSTEPKVNALVEQLIARPDAPAFYGTMRVDQVAKHLPDGERVVREIYEEIVSSMQGPFRKANRQIRLSKAAFGLPQASGALVFVNDSVKILSPEVMVSRVTELLRKRMPDGSFAFPEIEAVLLINETHVLSAGPGVQGPLIAIISRDGPSKAEVVLSALMPVWAKVHGHKYQKMDAELLATVPMKENSVPSSGPQKMTRQEYWEKQYRKYPYLRWHTADELKAYFLRLTESFAAGILKGATPAEKAMLPQLTECQTHFLQEAQERGLDFRTFGPASPPPVDEAGRPKFRQATVAELQSLMIKTPRFETGRFYTNEAGDYYRCIGVQSDKAQVIQMVIHAGKNVGLPKLVPRGAWGHIWPIVDERLIRDLEKRFLSLKGK